MAASAITSHLVGRRLGPHTLAQATLDSYTTDILGSAVVFAVGTVATALVLRSGATEADGGSQAVHL
jgi:hypothetical protein